MDLYLSITAAWLRTGDERVGGPDTDLRLENLPAVKRCYELTDAQLQGRRAHQAIDRIRRPLEQIFQPFAFRPGDHGRVLLGTQHGVRAVEKPSG